MERFLSLFLTLLICSGSSGFAVGNQKPASYWQGWFVPLSEGFSPVSQTQNLSPVLQASQSSLQPGASVSTSPVLQQSYDQSAGGSNWFGLSGQWVPLASQVQTSNPVPQTVPSSGSWTQGSQSSPQVGASASAFPALQQHYDQSVSWVPSQVQGVSPSQGPSSTAIQAQLTRPVPASGNVANLYATAQGAYGLQSSDFPSWSTQPQRPSSVATQFQPSQNAGQVSTSSGSSKWLKVVPPGLNPSWSSVTPPAWVPSTNNLYASLSKVAAPSADAKFQSAGLGSAFQTSGLSTTNSAPAFVSSSGVLPSLNLGVSTQGPFTWQPTGSSQSVLQGSASVGPAFQSNPLSSSPSRGSTFLPGATSRFSLVPGPNSQASSPYAQTPAVSAPSNQLNFNTVRPGSSSSVKG